MNPDLIEAADGQAAEPVQSRLARASHWAHGQANKVVVITGILLFVIIYFAPDIFYSIKSGEVGVLYLRFAGGTQTDRVLGEGMKIIPPWDKLFIYNIRVQEVKHSMDVLTSEGLNVKLDLSIRYNPEVEMVGLLHQKVGPDYAEKIVVPEVESSLRTAMAGMSLHDVYGSERGIVQTIINDSIEHISQKFVHLDEIVLRQVELPDSIKKTIEQKMAQKELAESYEFRLEVERQEAARRQIEAYGLAQYNSILNDSLTPNVLKWEGIQATKELAKSPNSKTIIIGNTANGLPLILGGGKPQD